MAGIFITFVAMAISITNAWNRVLSALDAEGSDRYLFDRDGIYAFAYANEMMVQIINAAFAETKLPAEALRELVKVRIWQTSDYSRFAYDSAALSGEKLWTLLSIHPEATTVEPPTIDPSVTGANSKVRLDLTFLGSQYSAGRLTFESWNINQKNIFLPGNSTLTNGFKQYAYLDFANYSSNAYAPAGTFEVQVRPDVIRKLIGVRYLKYPTAPTLITDSVEFPESATTFYVELALRFISFKIGDQTTTYQVTTSDVQTITSLLSQ